MSKLTITEALQEIKTINKRLNSKRESIVKYAVRDSRIKDPLEKDGTTSEKFITKEMQACADLENRIIKIRVAIQDSNGRCFMSVNDTQRTVQEWLVWRREVVEGQKQFLSQLTTAINAVRTKIQQQGGKVVAKVAQVTSFEQSDPPELFLNISEKKLIEDQENINVTLSELDGKLSLFNATCVIDIN